ncbi:MAG: hypothetical protein QOE41_3450 [Mycobacterium sp.]|jgi:hypothetical protein|nr:hypothetical protein [Mycobacterium sp.]MDT5134139.1 hypothetical protein [Mycobacterium sp.]
MTRFLERGSVPEHEENPFMPSGVVYCCTSGSNYQLRQRVGFRGVGVPVVVLVLCDAKSRV